MQSTQFRNPEVHCFLRELWQHLNKSLPSVDVVADEVKKESLRIYPADPTKQDKQARFLEAPFVTRFISPEIHRFLLSQPNFTPECATQSLISENTIDRKRGFANAKSLTGYPLRHPFRKSIGTSAKSVAEMWYADQGALSSKHPDFCLSRPFPIVFEAKYLQKSAVNGRKALVESVYEAFFYRGLAPIDEPGRAWSYKYAVALVYDGTKNADFMRAWDDLPENVSNALWNAGNVFVMPLRGAT